MPRQRPQPRPSLISERPASSDNAPHAGSSPRRRSTLAGGSIFDPPFMPTAHGDIPVAEGDEGRAR